MIRDPDRIDGVLSIVAAVWKASPDLRLGQLIWNAARIAGVDVFQIEEDRLTMALLPSSDADMPTVRKR